MTLRVALVQLSSSDDPKSNLAVTSEHIEKAAEAGARFVLTPEVTNCVSLNRAHQNSVLKTQAVDITLSALRLQAEVLGVWLLIGSLALKTGDPNDPRFVNRSFLISPKGEIAAAYDKIHMFDVELSAAETYRESDGFRPGEANTLTAVDGVGVGMTICYDVRFPYLYRGLAKAGAKILTVPAAFSPDTGPHHWETLLKARAIETGSFVLAPAQCGTHEAQAGRARKTFGHSLAIDPWGRVLADGGDLPGVTVVDLDLSLVDDTRRRLPSLDHERDYRKA